MAGELPSEIFKSPRARIWGERAELQEIKAERTPKGELRGNSRIFEKEAFGELSFLWKDYLRDLFKEKAAAPTQGVQRIS